MSTYETFICDECGATLETENDGGTPSTLHRESCSLHVDAIVKPVSHVAANTERRDAAAFTAVLQRKLASGKPSDKPIKIRRQAKAGASFMGLQLNLNAFEADCLISDLLQCLSTLAAAGDTDALASQLACRVNSPDGYQCDGVEGHELPHWMELGKLAEDDLDSGRREWLNPEPARLCPAREDGKVPYLFTVTRDYTYRVWAAPDAKDEDLAEEYFDRCANDEEVWGETLRHRNDGREQLDTDKEK